MSKLLLSFLILASGIVPAAAAEGGPTPTPPSDAQCRGVVHSVTKSIERIFEANRYQIKARAAVGTTSCGYYIQFLLTTGTASSNAVSAENYSFNAGNAIASVQRDQGFDDGNVRMDYSWRVEDDSLPLEFKYSPAGGGYHTGTLNQTINGFVQITGTAWSPKPIQRGNSSAYGVQLAASNHCGGAVFVTGRLTLAPGNTSYRWDGLSMTESVTKTTYVPSGGELGSAYFVFDHLNGPAGTKVTASSFLVQTGPNCDHRGPEQGSSASADLDIVN